MSEPRVVQGVYHGAPFHWVGDGFRVSNYFPSGNDLGPAISPFFLMDYHAPHTYAPSDQPRGVGAHPHRGFETVTIAFEGSVAHHDSAGNAGVIGPGDVQWMTAASGVLHKEYHAADFTRRGGTMHMMQLWVNLPRAHKMAAPRYQAITADRITRVALPDDGGEVRLIAGEYEGAHGPAQTFTKINLWEARVRRGGRFDIDVPPHENLAILVLDGSIVVNGGTPASSGDLVVFAREGRAVRVDAREPARLVVLGGEPIDEPVVAYGPFVMSSVDEIREAIADFNAGAFGTLA